MAENEFETPLKKAKGLGTTHHGSEHWMAQRITALCLFPLMIWFVYSFLSLKGASYDVFTAWLSTPINTILVILMLLSVFYHVILGAQVIAEDYISNLKLRLIRLIVHKIAFTTLAIACVFSVLKIAL